MSEDIKELTPRVKPMVSTKTHAKNAKIAVILVRGLTKVDAKIKDTLFMLRLRRKHACVVVANNPVNIGMIKKVKDYVTFGEIDEETVKLLIEKKGEKDPKDPIKLKRFFRLCPPVGGFERKGTKKPFTIGGALGERGTAIKDLINKMM